MPIQFTQRAVDLAVAPVIAKFNYLTKSLGYNALTVIREVTGIQDGNYYGRFTASGNPLIPFEPASSIAQMLETATELRAELQTTIDALIRTTEVGNVVTDLAPAIVAVLNALADAAANPLDKIRVMTLLAGFRIPYNEVFGADEFTTASSSQMYRSRLVID
jgi:hypothetical protein